MKQNGNAIVIILIAVSLFAALGYIFTNTSRTSTSLLSGAETEAYANQIIAYGNEVKSAIKRLQLRGCKDTEISFSNDVWKKIDGTISYPPNHNPNAPTDGSCDIFSQNGGQLQPKKISTIGISDDGLPAGAWEPGSFSASYARVSGIGTPESDLILATNLVSSEVCQKVNEAIDLTQENIPIERCGSSQNCGVFNGVYPISPAVGYGDLAPELEGEKTFCFHYSPSGFADNIYYVFNVLIAR